MQQDFLISQLQEGNEKAFERIYQLYSKSIFGVIFTILRDEALAEEILQDVFLKVWEKAPLYEPSKGRFFTWILNIARNASIDHLRSRTYKDQKKNVEDETFVDAIESRENFEGSAEAHGLEKYIKLLEPLCKNIIDMLFFKGYTQKESAKVLDIPLGTLKTRNRMCIKKLRASLK
ncbi:RNA polymerase sigma factor [Salinimicrobium sp. HB62]|uniref:RNA polymerase sigma factor n=1 Tax=Salinimicrobium sp. HB62 TaxID=3077781 RepID=UPI002D76757E|nr:sigma-70 family RNA polymerase sigma factor [Salinimicrobium sp. HB62]